MAVVFLFGCGRKVDHIYASPGDILSLTAYHVHKIRRTVWGEPFTHFLPFYINEDHFRRALPHIRTCIYEVSPSPPILALTLPCLSIQTAGSLTISCFPSSAPPPLVS